VILVLWKDSLGCLRLYDKSVTPPSKMLLKYRGMSVLPMAGKEKRKGEKIS
jgi:hypothetical protein